MRKKGLVYVIAVILVFSVKYSYGFSINISPPSFKAAVAPGGSASGSIGVQNNSDDEVGILAYTQDWLYNADGSKTFLAAGTTPRSCAKWISIFPKKFQLKPQERLQVQYTMNMPENTEGGYYAVIFFETVPVGAAEADEGMVVRFSGRLGTIVYLETEGKSTRTGSIETASVVPPQSNKPLELKIAMKNSGNVYIGAEGVLNIIDEEGNVYGKKVFGPINTLPGETREHTVEWLGDLGPGKYYAVATLDLGTEAPLVKEVEFTISAGAALKSFSVDAATSKPVFSAVVENTGQLNVNIKGKVDILGSDSRLVTSIDIKDTLIAPGKDKEIKCEPQTALAAGSYTAKASVVIEGKESAKEQTFTIR